MNPAPDQPRDGHIAWRALHGGVFVQWSLILAITIIETATNGELSRAPDASDHFSTSTVLYFVFLSLGTAMSALRAAWVEAA